ncbi:MAG: hypothetical protein HUU10_04335 [Bacteroidetes bacterium]|nr:hypothetical protein [Bacteroidota bacterium]
MITERALDEQYMMDEANGVDPTVRLFKVIDELCHRYTGIQERLRAAGLPLLPSEIERQMECDEPVFLLIRDMVESGQFSERLLEESRKGSDESATLKRLSGIV